MTQSIVKINHPLIVTLILMLLIPIIVFTTTSNNGSITPIPVGAEITDSAPYKLRWVKLVDEENHAEIVKIHAVSEKSADVQKKTVMVKVVTSLPQFFIINVTDGSIVSSTPPFSPPVTGVSKGPETYTAVSGNARFTFSLYRYGSEYAFYVYDEQEKTLSDKLLDYGSLASSYNLSPFVSRPISIQASWNGRYVLIGDRQGYLACYEAEKQTKLEPFEWVAEQTAPPDIFIVAGGETGNKAFMYSSNGTQVWDFLTGGKITSVEISDAGKYIVIVSENNKVYFLGAHGSHPRWKYQSSDDILTVDISANGSCVVIGDKDGNIIYWSNATNLSGNNPDPDWIYETIQGKKIYSVSISDDGTRIGAGGENRRVYFLDNTGNLVWPKVYVTGGDVRSVRVSNDGKHLVAGAHDRWVYYFGPSSEDPLWKYHADHEIRDVAISYYGDFVAAGSDHDDIYFFDAVKGLLLWSYEGHGKSNDLAMSYSGRYLASAGDGGRVYYFDTRTSSPLWTWKTPGKLNTISMASDGTIVVVGSDHREVHYWFGAQSLYGSQEGGNKRYGEGPAWSVDLGGKVTSVAVTHILGPTVTINKTSVGESATISTGTEIIYVDSSKNIYKGTLTMVRDTTQERIWSMDARGWFGYSETGTIRNGDIVQLFFTYPGETIGLGQSLLDSGSYRVYVLIEGITAEGTPYKQKIECGKVPLSRITP